MIRVDELPEQEQIDKVIGTLARLQDSMNELHRTIDNIAVARVMAEHEPNEKRREKAAADLESLAPDYPVRLDGLAYVALWAAEELVAEWEKVVGRKWERHRD